MSTIMQESTTSTTEDEFNPSVLDEIRWVVGYQTNRLGDYLVKLGDRIHGDEPMGVADAWEAGYARGLDHEPAKAWRKEDARQVGLTITAMLVGLNLTTDEVAAHSSMTADQVRDMQAGWSPSKAEMHEFTRVIVSLGQAKARQAATA